MRFPLRRADAAADAAEAFEDAEEDECRVGS